MWLFRVFLIISKGCSITAYQFEPAKVRINERKVKLFLTFLSEWKYLNDFVIKVRFF